MTMVPTTRAVPLVALALTLTLMAFAATASLAQESVIAVPAISVEIGETPDQLRQKAVALFENPNAHEQAAHFLRQESERRAADDPEAYNALAIGGRLFAYSGEMLDAQNMMEEAADLALSRGELIKAAHTYIDAAYIAQTEGKRGRVRELVSRAELLSGSPHLDTVQRSNILRRIGEDEDGKIVLN